MAFAASFGAPCVGLDIGSASIKAVTLKKRRTGWSLISRAEVVVKAQDGVSADPLAVSEAIRQLFDTLKLKRARVTAALSGQAVVVKRLTLPAMSEKQLAEAIPFEAEQYVPFDLADVQLDYQLLGPTSAEGVKAVDVLLVAARRDRIDDRAAIIGQAGQRATVMDLEAFALAN